MIDAIRRVISPLGAGIRQMIARAVIDRVNDATPAQTVQFHRYAGMVVDDGAERFAEYGFTSVPLAGAELVVVFLGGSRDHPIVIATQDRRYRLVGLENGEVAIHDDLGHKVHLTRTGPVIDGAGHEVKIVNAPSVRCETALFKVTGDIIDQCDGATPRSMAAMRAIYDAHIHDEHDGFPTTPPTTDM
jgi:phage baseplate assembly protein V